MADILFKPICSNCGKMIRGDVKYNRESLIIPYACPYCNKLFECIKVPKVTDNMLFDYEDGMYGEYELNVYNDRGSD